ncbi:hypothetical protein QO010_000594 [Caulobacter ginsengisoli]|uniref:Uncharacterized protein n=1 Tax=Caulobacter ginsengisoli TaxID=400775 RepID=A0ABU0ILF5_9CAUL|nr:hypothetical protein [Caulobacter ginsengisoli]MDQ0462846.1 hypothetical protein [Caulobacter ginsengisoli]
MSEILRKPEPWPAFWKGFGLLALPVGAAVGFHIATTPRTPEDAAWGLGGALVMSLLSGAVTGGWELVRLWAYNRVTISREFDPEN